jgi:hypothetical protein
LRASMPANSAPRERENRVLPERLAEQSPQSVRQISRQ